MPLFIFESRSPREQRHHHTHHTTITEVRAPTDESIRLADEMMQKCRDRILSEFSLPGNEINARVLIENIWPEDDTNIIVLMRLNHRTVRLEVKASTLLQPSKQDPQSHVERARSLFRAIVDAVAKRIAAEALAECFTAQPQILESLSKINRF